MKAHAWLMAPLVACLGFQGICPLLCGADLDPAPSARARLPELPCHGTPAQPDTGSPEDHSSACARCQDPRPVTVSSAPEAGHSSLSVALVVAHVEAPTPARRYFAAPWVRPEPAPPDLRLLYSTLLL